MNLSITLLFGTFTLLIFFVLIFIKYPSLIIKFFRFIVIIISILCILVNLLVENREDIYRNFLNEFLHDYTFFTSPILYILPMILIIFDINKYIKTKQKFYLYYLISIDSILPFIADYNYNLFFSRFINS